MRAAVCVSGGVANTKSLRAFRDSFSELCVDRNMRIISSLERTFPFPVVFNGMQNALLPNSTRAAFVKLMCTLWIDRNPHSVIQTPARVRLFYNMKNDVILGMADKAEFWRERAARRAPGRGVRALRDDQSACVEQQRRTHGHRRVRRRPPRALRCARACDSSRASRLPWRVANDDIMLSGSQRTSYAPSPRRTSSVEASVREAASRPVKGGPDVPGL